MLSIATQATLAGVSVTYLLWGFFLIYFNILLMYFSLHLCCYMTPPWPRKNQQQNSSVGKNTASSQNQMRDHITRADLIHVLRSFSKKIHLVLIRSQIITDFFIHNIGHICQEKSEKSQVLTLLYRTLAGPLNGPLHQICTRQYSIKCCYLECCRANDLSLMAWWALTL